MKILFILALLFASSCTRIVDGVYNLGDKMPTYDGNKCNASVHCFGENRQHYGSKEQAEQNFNAPQQQYQPQEQENLPENNQAAPNIQQ